MNKMIFLRLLKKLKDGYGHGHENLTEKKLRRKKEQSTVFPCMQYTEIFAGGICLLFAQLLFLLQKSIVHIFSFLINDV